jgi:ABC-type glycerol-3-phosphate transport system substrate-binding protein
MQKKLKRTFLSISVVSAFAIALAGCGSNSSGSSNSATPSVSTAATSTASARDLLAEGLPKLNDKIAAKGDVKLEAWLPADWADKQPVKDLVKEFESVYPNVSVNMSGTTWEDIPNKVHIAIAGGSPPDLSMQHAFAEGAQGYAEPLDDLYKEWGKEADFLPGSLLDVTWKNVKYGVPNEVNTTFLLYNKDIFKAAGLSEPTDKYTFAQLKADAKKIVDSKAAPSAVAISAGGWDTYGLVLANGGDLLNFDGGQVKATFNAPKVVEVLQMLHDLAKNNLAPMPSTQNRQSDNPIALFANKTVGMFYSGPWDLAGLKSKNPDIYSKLGTAPMPNGMDGATDGSVQGGGSLFIPKGSKNKEVTFELMKWFVSDKYASLFASEMGRNPVMTKQYENPVYKNDPLLTAFVTQLKTAKPYLLDAYPQASQAWNDLVRAAILSDNVNTAVEKAQQKAQQAIDKIEKK